MNMNDWRLNAYSAASNNKKNNLDVDKSSKEQQILKNNSDYKVQQTGNEQNIKPFSFEKPLFKDVNKKVAEILENKSESQNSSADYLKSGGLIKVPVSPKEKDGKDSVYRRVAKFLLLIGVDEAAKILPHLTQEQTEKIIPEIASIRNIEPEEASVILAEFQSLLKKSRESGGKETARTILEKAFGTQRAQQLLDKAAPLAGTKPFDYLNDADSERVFYLLSDESPQIQALVLSRLEPKKAAAVINLMKSNQKKDVIYRLAKMESVSPEVLRRVDQAMHEKSLAQTSEKAENLDGRNALASILKKMTPQAENDILSSLAEDDPELGQDLRSRLFTIDDVIAADDRFLQNLLRAMPDSEIAMLIVGKPDNFAEKILSCVSSGRRAAIKEERELKSPYRRSDVDKITASFFSTLRRAFEDGSLVIKGRNDDVYV